MALCGGIVLVEALDLSFDRLLITMRYPACNRHVPYCQFWPSLLYKIFLHYLINGKIFEKKKLFNIKCVFSKTFASNIFHSMKN